MAASHAPKRSPLTAATITQPQLQRQHSYNTSPSPSDQSTQSTSKSGGNATAVLANVASRTASPRRKPSDSPPVMERRTSWEECVQKREGYVSFPDFDALRAEREGVRCAQ